MRIAAESRVGRIVAACCVVMVALFGLVPDEARSAGGSVNVLPTPPKLVTSTSRVKVVIDSRWIDANGYRPVKVVITPLVSPAPAQRTFRVVLKPQSYYNSNNSDQISQIVELEQGATKAVASIPVPQDGPWHAIIVDIYEDGRLLDDLSGDYLGLSRGSSWRNESSPGILIIDSRALALDRRDPVLQILRGKTVDDAVKEYDQVLPDVRNLLRRFPESPSYQQEVSLNQSQKTKGVQVLSEIQDTPQAEILNFAELPDRWIEYSCCDLMVISLPDLADLGKQRPKVLRALGDWVRSGRTLIVYNVGERPAGLRSLEGLLQLPPLPKADADDNRGWRVPATSDKKRDVPTINDYQAGMQASMYKGGPPVAAGTTSEPTGPEAAQEVAAQRELDKNWQFLVRDAGLGNVVAFDGDPFPGTNLHWSWVLNSIRGLSWCPVQREGASQQERNEDFWNFLIPGTGQAPVLSFLVFITLFVMLIGPVNYIFLQRSQRLYLLLITVPLGAFLVTSGLFLYAMFTDGIGVKSRIRSYTLLDQRAGNVSSTSRQAYYASIAPSQGFQFHDDTIILPYLHDPTNGYNQRTFRRKVHWDEDSQQLRGGYIQSRTLSQVLVTRSGKTKARLRVGKAQGNKLPITNELKATLAYLLVADDDGKLYEGQKIKPGATELSPINTSDAASNLKRRLRDYTPEFPEGYSENMHDSPFDAWQFGFRGGRSSTNASQSGSLLERKLARFSHLGGQPLEPRSFVALCETNPEVPLGVSYANQYVSLHVLEGSW